MGEYLLATIVLGAWSIFSFYYFNRAYKSPSKINPYILDSIPSVFPTLGIMCTAIGITMGLTDFDPNNIQGSLPELISGLKSAFIATIAGIAGLIISQNRLSALQVHIDKAPDRPRQASDELTALNQISERLEKLEKVLRNDLQNVSNSVFDSSKVNSTQFSELHRLVATQTDKLEDHQRVNDIYNEKLLGTATKLLEIQNAHSEAQRTGLMGLVKKMDESNNLLTHKFDEFSGLLRKNNTEALVEVMRASTEQFNAQMSELIDRLVKENFQELNSSVLMLNSWQKENKAQVTQLTEQVQNIMEQVNKATDDLKTASETLTVVTSLNHQLVDEDGKLMLLIKELDKVMISDGKFTEIVDKVEGAVDTLSDTTEAFEETTQKLNVWVRNQMNFSDKAEILVKQLEEFRNLNGSVWDRYRAEMDKSVKIVANTSTMLSRDLENINQEFYDRLNDTLQNLDGLIQRFMNGQTLTRRG